MTYLLRVGVNPRVHGGRGKTTISPETNAPEGGFGGRPESLGVRDLFKVNLLRRRGCTSTDLLAEAQRATDKNWL